MATADSEAGGDDESSRRNSPTNSAIAGSSAKIPPHATKESVDSNGDEPTGRGPQEAPDIREPIQDNTNKKRVSVAVAPGAVSVQQQAIVEPTQRLRQSSSGQEGATPETVAIQRNSLPTKGLRSSTVAGAGPAQRNSFPTKGLRSTAMADAVPFQQQTNLPQKGLRSSAAAGAVSIQGTSLPTKGLRSNVIAGELPVQQHNNLQTKGLRSSAAAAPEAPGAVSVEQATAPTTKGLRGNAADIAAKRSALGGASDKVQQMSVKTIEADSIRNAQHISADKLPEMQSTEDIPAHQSAFVSDRRLAQAVPVQSTRYLMEAQEVDPEILEKQAAQSLERRKCRSIGCILLTMSCLVLGLSIGLTLGRKAKEASALPSMQPSTAPSGVPSSAPTGSLDMLLEELPEYTLASFDNISTPQWKALNWLSRHPGLEDVAEWRKMQLFALATFFYAMEGPNWPQVIQDNWLNYEMSECLWFSSVFGEFNSTTGQWNEENWYNLTLQTDSDSCNQQGEFLYLDLLDLQLADYKPEIPPEIALLTSLEVITLPANDINARLSAWLPLEFYNMTQLNLLMLNLNDLTGPLPSELGLLSRMTNLFIRDTHLSSFVPSELGLLDSLEWLELYHNNHSGPLPSELGMMTSMTKMHLYGNPVLNGPIPSQFGGMTRLTDLELHHNALSAFIPTEFGMITSLEYLQLNNNMLSSAIPTEFGNMERIVRLLLHDNNLTWHIPSEFGRMTSMERLDLEVNALSGSIPSQLRLLTNMTDLYLFGNALSGPIVSQLGLLTNIMTMDLEINMLSGSMPSTLGVMDSMLSLWLSSNSLTGLIPTELGLLTNLMNLRLDNNNLSGEIPTELVNLVSTGSLATVTLANNSFLGTIHDDLCSLGLYRGEIGLTFDCSDQLCGCCWCPCPGDNSSDVYCQTNASYVDDQEWPGLFPGPINSSNMVTINIRTDDYPEEIVWDWSQQTEAGTWDTLDQGSPRNASSLFSYTTFVESSGVYRLRLSDSAEDGFCCDYGYGWATITSSIPSESHSAGTMLWEARGDAVVSSVEVFLVIDALGYAHVKPDEVDL